MKKRLLLTLVLALIATCAAADISVEKTEKGLFIQSEYGSLHVQEPVIVELISSPAMERLKHISQYGVTCYARNKQDFSRYEHSIGVFALLRRFNAPLGEQIAGLLHDASHTVFSHVGDVLFNQYFNRYSYQDDIHEWFLEKVGITTILSRYGLEDCCTEKAKKSMRMLEQDKPDLCADRIDYLLRGGLHDDLLSQEDISCIVNDLSFKHDLWIFTSIDSARKIGYTCLWLAEHIFGAAFNAFTYAHAANALKRALDLNILRLDDIHFSTDAHIWTILKSSHDLEIQQSISKIEQYKDHFLIGNEIDHDIHYKAKFLGVDPLVETPNGLERLSALDTHYANEYNRIKNNIKRGWYVKHISH